MSYVKKIGGVAFAIVIVFSTIVIEASDARAQTAGREPIGKIENITDTEIRGWACDPDKPDAAIKVSIWQYGPRASGSYSKNVAIPVANQSREQAIKTACNSANANHGFAAAIPAHNPADLFYVYAQNIDASGATLNYPPLDRNDYIKTSELTANPSYRILGTNGSVDRPSTKAGHTNNLITDGVYAYAQILEGNFDDQITATSIYPGHNGIIDIKRSRLGSQENFVTIWSKRDLYGSFAEMFTDVRGALHIMYLECEPTCNRASVKYIKSDNPQASTPTFTDQPSPFPYPDVVCSTCRWTLLYDRPTDTIHATMNTPYLSLQEKRWYTYKKPADAAWHPRELVYTANTIVVHNGPYQDTSADWFFYPHLVIFKGMIHIFATGNTVDNVHPGGSFFNGVRHFYKPLGASVSPWQSEWLQGPFFEPTIHAFSPDVMVTPTGKLAVLITNTFPNNRLIKPKAILFTSATGKNDWQQSEDLPSGSCFEYTNDGMLHMFSLTQGNFLRYGKSADGVTWQIYQLPPPAGMQRRPPIDPSCAGWSSNAPLVNPIAAVTGLLTTQTLDTTKLPSLYMPQGSTVAYLELPASALPKPTLTVTHAGPIESGSVAGLGIDCGSDCSQSYAYGTSVTLTASPASGSAFAGWSGSCTGIAPTCTVKMDMNRSVQAMFASATPPPPPPNPLPLPPPPPPSSSYTLTVTKSGIGQGTVTGAGIDCGNDCSGVYANGASVVLTAVPLYGSTFTGWFGSCTGTGDCTVLVDGNKMVEARFSRVQGNNNEVIIGIISRMIALVKTLIQINPANPIILPFLREIQGILLKIQ